jgi:NAD(P)-dependent dehydrogenase (short-subunit alcohol dehydrogenase family)
MTDARVADQTGRTILVTGTTGGIGFFASLQLAQAGARVVVTGRNPERIAAALRGIRHLSPGADVLGHRIDTAELESIPDAVAAILEATGGQLHGLITNAGITMPPKAREVTDEGHERIIATNALGHFVLGASVLTTLAASARESDRHARIVWLGSLSTAMGRYDPVDLELERGYTAWRAYVQSKVVVQALGFEAAGRLAAHGIPVDSVVAHPGYALGGRDRRIPGINEPTKRERFIDELQASFTQSKERGAWPIVHAMASPEVHTGEFWGPAAWIKGTPKQASPAPLTTDPGIRGRIWRDCVEATGVDWPIDAVAAASR